MRINIYRKSKVSAVSKVGKVGHNTAPITHLTYRTHHTHRTSLTHPTHQTSPPYLTPPSIPRLLPLIGSSWDFCRKQQAVAHVLTWFLFLPMLGSSLLTDVELRNKQVLEDQPELQILLVLAYIVLSLTIMWGSVCMLTIGKRLLQAKSGRSRSSFKVVRTQAGKLFIPYVLTTILRSIFLLLWTLLLIIPGLIYAVRTVFYPVIVVCEDTPYRAALARSKSVVQGKFWAVAGTVVGLALLTLIPAQILAGMFGIMAKDAPAGIMLAGGVASSIIIALSLTVYLLSLIQAYDYFRPSSVVSN